jgi:hypothetical protein
MAPQPRLRRASHRATSSGIWEAGSTGCPGLTYVPIAGVIRHILPAACASDAAERHRVPMQPA